MHNLVNGLSKRSKKQNKQAPVHMDWLADKACFTDSADTVAAGNVDEKPFEKPFEQEAVTVQSLGKYRRRH